MSVLTERYPAASEAGGERWEGMIISQPTVIVSRPALLLAYKLIEDYYSFILQTAPGSLFAVDTGSALVDVREALYKGEA